MAVEDKDDVLGNLTSQIQVKIAYVGTFGNPELNLNIGDINTMMTRVNANPAIAVTLLMTSQNQDGSFLIPTDALNKLHEAIKDNKNGDNKVHAFTKLLFQNRITAMIGMENAFKALKDIETGGFDMVTKYMLVSQYFEEG